MVDISALRQNPDKYKKGVGDKGYDTALVDKALEADKKYRETLQKVESLRAERNRFTREKNIDEGRRVKSEIKKLEPELSKLEEEYLNILKEIPNLPSEDTPRGKDESENKVIRSWGTPKKFDFEPKDHVELGKILGIIDVETSAVVSGARFNYLKGDAVLLHFALIQFALEVLTSKEKIARIAETVGNSVDTPFIPVVPPVMMKTSVMDKMDRLNPRDERYVLEKDDLVLVGSAEHTLGPMHMDTTFTEKELPLRYVGYSTAFRREAGSYGKDTTGILRVHQFDKLEMESFSTQEMGEKEHYLMTAIQEYFMQQLGIPYQVIAICTGDMGKPNYKQTDINSWIPSQNRYRETHTADFMTDYQARRLNTRVQRKDKTEFVYMNDATAFAIGRTLIAILENYQQDDGSVVVPEVLRKWMGKEKIEAAKK